MFWLSNVDSAKFSEVANNKGSFFILNISFIQEAIN